MSSVLLLSLAALIADPAASAALPDNAVAPSAAAEQDDSRLFERARALAASGEHARAIAVYDTLLARDPANADARLARGRTYAWMRRWDASEADLRAVTAAAPDYADAWSALGDLYLWSDRPAQALEAYSRWHALQPDSPNPLLARSRANHAAGNVRAARSDLEAATARGADPAGSAQAQHADAAARVSSPDAVAPEGFTWTLQAEYGRTSFSSDRADWHDSALVLRRHAARGSVALETLETRRFSSSDHAWAVDAYVDTWARAYANLRYQHATGGDLLPNHAWRAELFQGVGRGWELSASIDQLRFSADTATIYGAAVGRYVGPFYLRARARYSTSSDSFGHQGLVRWYYNGNGSEYFEVSAGTGRSSQDERFGTAVGEDTSSAGVAFVRYFSPSAGVRLAAGYVDDSPSEMRLQGALYYRW